MDPSEARRLFGGLSGSNQHLESEHGKAGHPQKTKAYTDAGIICALHGDEARARQFMLKALEEKIMLSGAEHFSTLALVAIHESPRALSVFGRTQKWATTLSMTPDHPDWDSPGFQTWLWENASELLGKK